MDQLEFQLGCLADEVNSPFRIRQTRQLYSDTLRPFAADTRLTDPKGINTIADFFKGLCDHIFTEILQFFGRHVVQPYFPRLLPQLASTVLIPDNLFYHTPVRLLAEH